MRIIAAGGQVLNIDGIDRVARGDFQVKVCQSVALLLNGQLFDHTYTLSFVGGMPSLEANELYEFWGCIVWADPCRFSRCELDVFWRHYASGGFFLSYWQFRDLWAIGNSRLL